MKEKSILIRDEQHDWLTDDTCYVNLSALVRGHLDELNDDQEDTSQ